MATEVEKLVVSLEARFNQYEKALDRASNRTNRSAKEIETTWTKTSKFIANVGKGLFAGIATAGLAGTVAAVQAVADQVARIGDEAKRSGLGVRAFQEFKYVAEQNRVGVDALVDGFKELSLRADEFIVTGKGSGAEAFARLGISATELRAKLSDPSALFTEIIGKLQTLDQAAQIRIADELFGGTGGEQFVQLIGQGEEGIRRTIDQAHQLGIVLSDETVAAADELDRKFGAVTTTVGNNLKRAIVDATAALVNFIESLPNTGEENFAALQAEAAGFRAEIEQFAEATKRVAPESEAAIRLIIKAVEDGGLSADKAGEKLREMASIDMTLFPISTSLDILFGQLERVQGKAKETGAAIAAAASDPVGSGPSYGQLQSTFFPPKKPGGGGGGGKPAPDTFKDAMQSVRERIQTLQRETELMGQLGPAFDDHADAMAALAATQP